MESVCEYCKGSYVPKRTDSRYCSHSCRQLAYVLRKAKIDEGLGELKNQQIGTEPSIKDVSHHELSISRELTKHESVVGLTDKTQEPSIELPEKSIDLSIENGKEKETSTELTDKTEEPSIKVSETSVYPSKKEDASVNTESGLSVNRNKIDAFIYDKAVNSLVKPVQEQEKYRDYNCPLLDEIVELTQERDHLGILYSFLHNKTEGPAYWVSIHYRCLLECLLTFSEMQSIELDDLKEVCNAFTSLVQSRFYNYMIPEYPFLKEIPWLRDTIKNLCLNAEEETLTFRLKKETKLKLIAARWELANYVPKVSFDQLNFRE